jgi:hypothetical protein
MSTPPLPPEQIKRRVEMIETCLREGYSPLGVGGGKGSAVEEAARRLNLSGGQRFLGPKGMRSVKIDWTLYKPAKAKPVKRDTEEHQEQLKSVVLQDRVTSLEAQIKALYREQASEEAIREQILGLSKHTVKPAPWLVSRPSSRSGFSGIPTMQWSDWHCGEVVLPGEVNGVNEYNWEVAKRRIRKLVENNLDLCFNHMTGDRDYPGLVIQLIGDIISGMLHPELERTDEGDIPEQIIWVVDVLADALATLLKHFKAIQVVCAPGNHGRVFDKKPPSKKYVTRNADWLIYQILERTFKSDPRITFYTPKSGEALYRVYGHRYMAVHGDDLGVRGGDGIIGAIGPIMRGEIKMRTSSAQIGRDYDTLCMGHWHQRLLLPRAIVNNTLKGYDEFARRFLRAVFSEPSQNLWFTHPKHGITAHWEVFVEKRAGEFVQEWFAMPKAAA